jgi:ABC-type nitrate/sulfonate/bicarbonate transport system ATPase subunit
MDEIYTSKANFYCIFSLRSLWCAEGLKFLLDFSMILEVKELCYSYNPLSSTLQNVNFNLKNEEIVTLIGASGSGKTTLFNLLTGLLKPKSGSIEIANGSKLSYMMQDDLLLPWRTILDNLLLVGELGEGAAVSDEEALELLDQMKLSGCRHMYPDQLSGGMRQRVSLARAFLQKRPVLLLDEPFRSLDIYTRDHMFELLKEFQRRHRKSILMVTHDFRDAITLSNRILLLSKGRIVQEWSVSDEVRQDSLLTLKFKEELRNTVHHSFNHSINEKIQTNPIF